MDIHTHSHKHVHHTHTCQKLGSFLPRKKGEYTVGATSSFCHDPDSHVHLSFLPKVSHALLWEECFLLAGSNGDVQPLSVACDSLMCGNLAVKQMSSVWNYSSVAEHLPNMSEALGLISSITRVPPPPKKSPSKQKPKQALPLITLVSGSHSRNKDYWVGRWPSV